jgi:predicted helicase
VKTNRDAWTYSPSRKDVVASMERMIAFYNDALAGKQTGELNDATKIGWSWVLRKRFEKGQAGSFSPARAVTAFYRPFEKRWLYYDGFFNENRYQMPKLFPNGTEENLVIGVSAGESRSGSRRDGITDAGLAHFQSAYPARRSPRKTSSTTSTASSTPRTTASATPTTSARSCRASRV